jgi:hypothetical protein
MRKEEERTTKGEGRTMKRGGHDVREGEMLCILYTDVLVERDQKMTAVVEPLMGWQCQWLMNVMDV